MSNVQIRFLNLWLKPSVRITMRTCKCDIVPKFNSIWIGMLLEHIVAVQVCTPLCPFRFPFRVSIVHLHSHVYSTPWADNHGINQKLVISSFWCTDSTSVVEHREVCLILKWLGVSCWRTLRFQEFVMCRWMATDPLREHVGFFWHWLSPRK